MDRNWNTRATDSPGAAKSAEFPDCLAPRPAACAFLERYLEAIRPLLPQKEQADILRELSDDILSQMEDKSAQLGRPLTEDEQAGIIKKHGHPVVAAARYARSGYLIGPEVFPFYWLTLKIAAIGALMVRSIVAIVLVLISPHPSTALAPALLGVPLVLGPVFFWVTGAFAGFELYRKFFPMHLRLDWDPRALPQGDQPEAIIPRTHSAAELIFGFGGLVWWQLLPGAPFLALGPAALVVGLAPVWQTLHWPVVLLIVASLAQSAVNFLRPQVTPVRARLNLAIRAAGLILLGIALRAGEWVVPAAGLSNPAEYATLVHVLNQVLFYCLVAGLILGAVQLAWEGSKQLRPNPVYAGARPHF